MSTMPWRSYDKIIIGTGLLAGLTTLSLAWYLRRNMRSDRKMLDLIQELQKSTVVMKDQGRVETLVAQMVRDGKENLQVIADYDRTMSRYKYNGKLVPTCHNTMEETNLIPEWCTEKLGQLKDTYYPMEIDPTRPEAEKYPLMVEWWTKAHNVIVQSNLSRQKLEQVIAESDMKLREDTDWMIMELHRFSVPLLIFSAGVGDVIELTLQREGLMYDNIKIVSNFMDFNHQGSLVGFKEELIHSFNKNESAIHKTDYFERQGNRKNILLLGDSLGDLKMATGAKGNQNVLKIGFLNDKIEERLPDFLEGYDIVLISDETMDVPNGILREIFKS